MGERLRVEVEGREGEAILRLIGTIDETQELTAAKRAMHPGVVMIDVGGVERMNSMGVRWWLTWIAEMEARDVTPIFLRCPRVIVGQANLVHNFLGQRGWMESLYLPYFCPKCDREQDMLFALDDLGDPPTPPGCWCEECDAAMEFGDVADAYFTFVRRLRTRPRPERRRRPSRPPPRTTADGTMSMPGPAGAHAPAADQTLPTVDRSEPGTKPEVGPPMPSSRGAPVPFVAGPTRPEAVPGEIGSPDIPTLRQLPGDADPARPTLRDLSPATRGGPLPTLQAFQPQRDAPTLQAMPPRAVTPVSMSAAKPDGPFPRAATPEPWPEAVPSPDAPPQPAAPRPPPSTSRPPPSTSRPPPSTSRPPPSTSRPPPSTSAPLAAPLVPASPGSEPARSPGIILLVALLTLTTGLAIAWAAGLL